MQAKARSFALVILVLAVIAVAALSFAARRTEKTAPLSQSQTFETDFKQRLGAVGAEKAYAEFSEAYANAPFDVQHKAAHSVGKTLYDALGIAGLDVCDSSFAFGCYHSFFERAIAALGTPIIPRLADECTKKYGKNDTGCKHGIGHGIMEYVGPNKLLEGLALCKKTNQEQPLFGCTSGLFMEYNHPAIISGDSASLGVRPVVSGDLYAPCDALTDNAFKLSCYFEMGSWWKSLFMDDYARIGNLCTPVSETAEREACYEGWGSVVADNAGYSVAKAGEICGLIKNPRGASICKMGVALRWSNEEKAVSQAKELCASLKGDLAEKCHRETGL